MNVAIEPRTPVRSDTRVRLAQGAGGAAEVEFSAKLLSGGRIVAGKVFAAKATAEASEAPAVIAAVNEAFGNAVTELVVWTAKVLQGIPAPKRP